MKRRTWRLSSAFVLLFCSGGYAGDENIKPALNSLNLDEYKSRVETLASDEFMGRAPATQGEEKTIRYLAEQFKAIGLKPGNGAGYFQDVPMVKITADPASFRFAVSGNGQALILKFADDFVAGTSRLEETINVRCSDFIFAGYGIVAPEYDWNDYAGLDVKGKTVFVLVNDPGFATGDNALFTGKAMTYYGRWTYKFEEAARQGAAGVVIIHETEPAGYPYDVVRNGWSGPQFQLDKDGSDMPVCSFQGWVTQESARKIFALSGLDYEKETATAARRGFKAVDLGLKINLSFRNAVEHTLSHNVVALWPGSDLAGEYVIYMAHWDHFGVNEARPGDKIFNGAVDNATGTAALLQLAEAFTRLPQRQRRSILFVAVTGEEQGLLGSAFYAGHPLFPLNKTAGAINMDAFNIFGKMKDITVVGFGMSELDDLAGEIIQRYGRYVVPDPTPEKGGYFRSDHFSLAKAGLPSLYISKGVDSVEHGRQWGLDQAEKWTREHYHQPSDEYRPDLWNFEGMMDDLKIYFEVGYALSMTGKFPNWREGTPYKAARDEMMGRK
ncbi:MAG: M28 family metallopeptidase [Candidatus Aminicenantes bacterium]|nr:M28 family metallopeptidase [Candidatus Aminicenantes bacterium]